MSTKARKERKRNLRKYRPLGFIADPEQFAFHHPDKSALPIVRENEAKQRAKTARRMWREMRVTL